MIGFDIGGTKCAVCTGDIKNGNLVIADKRIIPTDHSLSPYEVTDQMFALAREMTDDLSTVGISCGGPLDSSNGVILSPPNLPGWDQVKICEYINKKYGAEAYLENDANACAVAEWKFGAGKGCRNMIFMTFGTGLGAGLILDGKLYRGACDMAGETGHIRLSRFGPVGFGKSGSFEGFCSGGGIAQLGKTYATERLQTGHGVSFCQSFDDLDSITAKSIAECANRGESDAAEVYSLCGRMFGRGLSLLIDILNPETIVVGSIFARAEHLLRPAMEEVLKEECLSYSLAACRVLPAALGENIGDYAALSVAAMNREETKH